MALNNLIMLQKKEVYFIFCYTALLSSAVYDFVNTASKFGCVD